MRYFIALEIPDECRQDLKMVQDHLKQVVPGVRLTNNEKLHLTIAFIGEESDKLQSQLVGIIKNASVNIPTFQVTPAYIDGFPNLHEPHTFWVGVKGDIDKLFVIRERIKDGLINLGLDVDERRYIPHIAIAKINNNYQLGLDQENRLQEMMLENSFEPIQINSIKLFESVPEHGFHRHNTLAQIPLASKVDPFRG